MLNLIFATNNSNKVEEIRGKLPKPFHVLSLAEAGINIDIPEPYQTLEENASEKSRAINALTGLNCFSEDTGLEVNALSGEPGVRSARYAGDACNTEENIKKLLHKMAGQADRSAQFRTVVSLQLNGTEYLFEGICEGKILTEKIGTKGFGYDPVFVPAGSNKSFGEMDKDEKAVFSHRAKAIEAMAQFLNQVLPQKHLEKKL